MTLTLYNFPQSTCSQKVRLVLWEKGLGFEDHIVDHKGREHLGPAYLKLNPNGVVPTLLHDEAVIIDSSVIVEYLEEVFPETPMSMEDPVGRAHLRKWLRYFEEVPTPAIRVPSFNNYLVKRYAALSEEDYRRMADSHPIRKHFYHRLGKTRFGDAETEEAMDRLDQTLARMEAALADGRPWLMGERLTIADACVMPTIDRMRDMGFAGMWETDRPNVAAWYARYAARPAFQKTYYKGTRLTEIFGDAA
ncbi:MAG: glutathione S-transferase family protein [Alphaproteobacteria bacterium]